MQIGVLSGDGHMALEDYKEKDYGEESSVCQSGDYWADTTGGEITPIDIVEKTTKRLEVGRRS